MTNPIFIFVLDKAKAIWLISDGTGRTKRERDQGLGHWTF
jgi:hypothetical protein